MRLRHAEPGDAVTLSIGPSAGRWAFMGFIALVFVAGLWFALLTAPPGSTGFSCGLQV